MGGGEESKGVSEADRGAGLGVGEGFFGQEEGEGLFGLVGEDLGGGDVGGLFGGHVGEGPGVGDFDMGDNFGDMLEDEEEEIETPWGSVWK